MSESEQYAHSELTRKIIGCAMEVHRTLGNGFQEVIYQRALAYEMSKAGLAFAREIEQDIFYKDVLIPMFEFLGITWAEFRERKPGRKSSSTTGLSERRSA